MTCQSPNGNSLYLEEDAGTFLKAAKDRNAYGNPIETHSDNLQYRTELIFNYYPYLDEKTGAVLVKGQVTCGLLEGINNINQHNYSEGILNMPVQIDVTKPIFPAIQYDGIGGYRITISVENQKETRQHLTQ